MDKISISTVIGIGTLCLFVGIYLGKQSRADYIQSLQSVKRECWSHFESAAKGEVKVQTAFSEFEDWIQFQIETEEAIQEAGYHEFQQRY